MSIERSGVVVCAVICAVLAGPLSATAGAQEVIYLVRHAERLDDSRDPPLSADGTARAARLVEVLRDAGITKVFTTQYRRTVDTGRPLAEKLGLPLVQIEAGRHRVLLDAMRAEGPAARILVVGHSDTVPELLEALGCERPVTIARGEYDNLFLVVSRAGTAPLVVRLRY